VFAMLVIVVAGFVYLGGGHQENWQDPFQVKTNSL